MYNKSCDEKWQKKWEDTKITNFNKKNVSKKYYCLEMFSYPSAAKLHLGHWYNYSVSDSFARYKKMQGYEVFQPMGFDAFGLPAENFAIKTGIHPKDSTLSNIETMEKQLKAIGAYFNFDAEIITCNEDYYKWTQWIFLKLYEKGLAYRSKANVNFCPSCNTVLANEQVINGECERCSNEVIKKDLTQWFFKITEYAEELLEKLDSIDWPEKTKKIQTNWIGKSVGSTVKFKVENKDELEIEVFTTRVDTLCGVTYVVVAPEREIVKELVTPEHVKQVEEYIEKTRKITEIDRLAENREKTGVFTGSYAINPLTGDKVQIWIADYVLSTYGTGSVMAVPAHDERDFEFAKKYNLPIKQVIAKMFGGKIKEDAKNTKRNTVVSIIKHSSEDKYLILDWVQNVGSISFVMGGIEENETPVEAAIREMKEETGYINVKEAYELKYIDYDKFYAPHKDVNREILQFPVYIELENQETVETKEEDTKFHTFRWISKDELLGTINVESQKYICEMLDNPKAMTDNGILINSGEFNGLTSEEAKEKVTQHLKSKNIGDFKTTYRLRDWLVSRQRYWGAPIPVIYCDTCGIVPIPEKELPVKLPYNVEFKPDGKSPLAKCEEFVNTTCPKCGNHAKREVDTLDTFVCSSWYQFRYPDNKNSEKIFDTEWINKMLPVDKYIGGAEHAAMHLLYARFITKVLRDIGITNCDEPFKSLVHQGLILGPDGNKMSKSKGNVIAPDNYVDKYGSDVFRMYIMFAFAYTDGGPWSEEGIVSMSKFVSRLERIIDTIIEENNNNSYIEIGDNEKELLYLLNNNIVSITKDIEVMQFNTAIARIMEIVNELYKCVALETKNISLLKDVVKKLLVILAPFMPHFAEEKWEKLGMEYSVFNQEWIKADEKYLVKDVVEMAVQINGSVKFKIVVNVSDNEKQIEEKVLQDERLAKFITDKTIRKIIVIKSRIINIVAN